MVNREQLREEQYGSLGRVLAGTATRIGSPITCELTEAWANCVARLATADDISEQNPLLLRPHDLLELLEIHPLNASLVQAADRLLKANIKSMTALTLADHFTGRSAEATSCVELLRYQSGGRLAANEHLWAQLTGLTVSGTHLDSYEDCREDSVSLPFSASQLACGALKNMFLNLREVKPSTLLACRSACREEEIEGKIIRRLAKPFIGSIY